MNTRASLQEAYRLIKAGDRAAAVPLIRAVIKQEPDNVNAWWLLANAVTERKLIQQALEKVLAIDPFHDKAQEKLDRLQAGVTTNVGDARRVTSSLIAKIAERTENEVEVYDPETSKRTRAMMIMIMLLVLGIVGVTTVFILMSGGDDETASVIELPTSAPSLPPAQPTATSEIASVLTLAPSETPIPPTATSALPPTWTPAAGAVSSGSQPGQVSFGMSGDVPRFDERPCEVEIPGFALEGRDVICGDLIVPASWSNPTGPTFKVAVSIVKSVSPSPRTDPLVLLQGGPGGSSVDTFTAPLLEFLGEYFLEERDVIMIDQRGTLYSEPSLDCLPLDAMYLELYKQVLAPQDENLIIQQALADCRTRFEGQGISLADFNSVDNAADVEALRQVMGYEQINLYGVSYGSLLALHVLKNYPAGLRSVIIDAVVPPQVNYMAEMPQSAEDVFDRFFQACADDPQCSREFPDLENIFAELVQRLNTTPLVISIEHPVTGVLYDEIYITGNRLVEIVFNSMYSSSGLASLPRMIFDIYNGNVVLLKKSFREWAFDPSFSEGVYYSVNCREDGAFDPAEVRTEGVRDYLIEVFANSAHSYREQCGVWGVPDFGATIDEAVVSDVPVLVYVGEFDPIIGSQWGLLASETLSQSKVYIFPGLGHGAAFDDLCPMSILQAFLEAPATTPSPACIRDMGLAFNPPTGALYQDSQARFMVAVPSGWEVIPNNDYGDFRDPETGSEIFVTAVSQRDLATGIGAAIQQVFPRFFGSFEGVEGVNILGDEWQVYYYFYDGAYVVAAGMQNGGTTYAAITLTDDIFGFIYSGVLEELLVGFDYQ